MPFGPLTISAPSVLLLAALLAAGGFAVLFWRRRRIRPSSCACAGAAMLTLTLAAGGLVLQLPARSQVTVLVDVSASTRGAPWRDAAWVRQTALRLAPAAALTIIPFADGAAHASSDDFKDILTAHTAIPQVTADAVLLFSDGQFIAPASLPPIYPVVTDWRPRDARVMRLAYASTSGEAQATVINDTGEARTLRWSGDAHSVPVAAGNSILTPPPRQRPGQGRLEARVQGLDPWPENDAACLPPPLTPALERWWIGADASAGFRAMTPAQLPREAAEFLAAGLVVLNDVAPEQLPLGTEDLLEKYVRDLGGSVLLICGQTEYGAWRNHPLKKLMPLAPDPPAGSRRWIVLLDRSGSMAATTGAGTRWQMACAAGLEMLHRLPGEETASMASFASSLTWLIEDQKVAQLLWQPPALMSAASPSGSTNLEPVLLQMAQRVSGSETTELLLLSDAQVSLTDVAAVIRSLQAARVRVSVLALSAGSGLPLLQAIADGTGGVVLREPDPARWSKSAAELAAAAAPAGLETRPLPMQWNQPRLPAREVAARNQAWPRAGASVLAAAAETGKPKPLVAQWSAGCGLAAAAMTSLTPSETQMLAGELLQFPSDPSVQADWDNAAEGVITVRGASGGKPLNALRLKVRLTPLEGSGEAPESELEQVAPGRYTGEWNPPGVPSLGLLLRDGRTVSRAVLAGQPATEFLRLGVDRAALEALAQRTGGRMVAAEANALDLPRPREQWRLTPTLGSAGSILLLLTAALLRREPA